MSQTRSPKSSYLQAWTGWPWERWSYIVGLYLISIFAAFALSALLVWATDGSWQEVFSAFLDGSLRNPGRWGLTISYATPLLLVALGAIVAVRGGLINIGQEGQLYIGAAFCIYVAVRLSGPGPFVLIVALLAGAAAGAIWAGIAAWLKYWRRVPEVLTTLLLVTVAAQLVGYGLKTTTLLLDRSPEHGNRNQISEQLTPDVRLPKVEIFGNSFPMSAFVALLLAIGLIVWLSRTTGGFRLTILGRNDRLAQRVGISAPKYGTLALLASGAFAGLAGAMMLTGGDLGNYRLAPGFSGFFGWEGLLVALVARNHPLVAIPMALVFGALRTGGGFLSATGVEREIANVTQALLVLALLVPAAVLYLQERRRQLAAVEART